MISCGIDVAQDNFVLCVYDAVSQKDITNKQFKNNISGFLATEKLLKKYVDDISSIKMYLESTGGLEQGLFTYFIEKKVSVYIICPRQSKSFKRALFQDQKTYSIDAKTLARMIVLPNISNSHRAVESCEMKELKLLLRQREFLMKDKTRMILRLNRLIAKEGSGFEDSFIFNQLKDMEFLLSEKIIELEKELYSYINKSVNLRETFDRLISIPCIGKTTACTLMQYLGTDAILFDTADKFCAFSGLYPVKNSSGKFCGDEILTQKGCRYLRRSLYLSALTGISKNKKIKSYFEVKKMEGKKPKQILIAIANKIARVTWSVVKNKTYFDNTKFLVQYA